MRSWAKDEGGATAVEFALLTPVLLAIVMGIMEFGMILYTYNMGGMATRDVARQIATNRLAAAGASAAVKAELPGWVQSAATVTVTQTTPSTPATNQITVNLSFPATAAAATSFMSFAYGTTNLQTSTTMQQETAP